MPDQALLDRIIAAENLLASIMRIGRVKGVFDDETFDQILDSTERRAEGDQGVIDATRALIKLFE